MPTAEKEATVKQLSDLLRQASGVYLTDFTGVNVIAFTQLRRRLRDEGVSFRVVKNRLAKLAAREAGVEGLDEMLKGPTGLVSTAQDPVAPARILATFAKESQGRPAMKAGLVDGRIVLGADLERLAQLPPKEILLGQVVTAVQGPISGLAFCLNGILQKLVLVLEAVREKKGEVGQGA